MLVIDKSNPVQRIILTLTEITGIADAEYIVKLKHDATRFEYTFSLPVNVSPAPERFDLFLVTTSVFDDMPTGYYIYLVFTNSPTPGHSFKSGKLLIKDLEVTEYVTPPNTDTNEYIIY
ncbi:hypothetical protein [Mucilaginibacter kameinonensis]|uniref:hypothetical protein n=1 Tax=Mucilaginibacter kameinonensis TaxID=452286 RepID=UPI000EF7F576|nr:hypothetical protein [Mucilaginibacter kameinonensis]